MSQSSYNNANQLTSRTTGSGAMEFAGSLNEQATVSVAGNSATVDHGTTNFVGYTSVTNGTNVVPVTAADYSGNIRTNKYQLVVTNNGVAKTITYDLNGNETNVVTATSTNSYQWDAANRLVQITQLSTNNPQLTSLFTYDGLGRRVQIIEKTNGVPYVTNKFVWCGAELCEQRDLTGATVTKRFFGGGEQIAGTNYYFTRDHLGSIREMVDNAGAIQARYDYDPYGRRIKVSGSLDADFGYAGMYHHAVSGLNLAFYRAYDPDLGRWLSRDPLAEVAGLNLYAYVDNNPVNEVDPLGDMAWIPFLVSQAAILIYTLFNPLHDVKNFPKAKEEEEKRKANEKKAKKDKKGDDCDDDPPDHGVYVFDGSFEDARKKFAPPEPDQDPVPIPIPMFPVPIYQPEVNYYRQPFIPGLTPSETLTIGGIIIVGGLIVGGGMALAVPK